MEFTDNIDKILKTLSVNQSALATKLGVSRGIISEFASGAREPSKEFLFGISKLGISLDWFLTGKGEMFLEKQENSLKIAQKPGESYKVPLLRQKVSCGPGTDWQNEDNIVDYIDVFGQIPRLKIERLFALRAEGSSMLGAGIRNGDYVLFNSAKDQWPHDGIYVFALDGDVYCKRLEFDMTKIKIYSVRFADLDKAELMATLDSEDISTTERLTILGRVLYWIHPNLEE
jgi:SOS-response transcriptional repressor LexA